MNAGDGGAPHGPGLAGQTVVVIGGSSDFLF